MNDEIGRREFLKRGGMVGVMATGGLPLIDTLTRATSPAAATIAPHAEHPSLARRFDTREFCLSEYAALAPKLSFSANNASAARAWQRRARAKLIERIGGLPATKAPLNAEVLETVDFGSYTREKVVFDTRHNLSAVGYLLVPKAGARPLPAVVCVSGHGRGLADILGLNDDGSVRAERGVGYAKEYALQCVEHGYVTFAVEQLALGARRDEAARKSGPTANSCQPAACAAVLLGQSMAAWRVWDAMRAIDYLSTRREVDANRIATLGASGGGTTSLLTAALDERVKVAVVSAYFNTFRDSIVSIAHCPDNYVPGLLQDMEMYDLSGLVAPRRLFVESGRKDRIFPIEGFQTAVARARAIYEAFGVPEHFGADIHEGAHEFDGVRAFEFMSRSV